MTEDALPRPDYTPYRVASRSWMTGGNVATCAAQPTASCCLKPVRSCWNMLLSSGEGWFHRTIALQNHSRLCDTQRGPRQYHTYIHIMRQEERSSPLTFVIPAGFVWTRVQRPRNAESFSSLSLISYSAWHHACANSGKSGATRDGCINPMRPIDTAAFSWRLLGALGWSRMGIKREISGGTHCWNSGSSDGMSSAHQVRTH